MFCPKTRMNTHFFEHTNVAQVCIALNVAIN
nr:MAG TPA: hypothetical protein [Caudoviricetes sp.]